MDLDHLARVHEQDARSLGLAAEYDELIGSVYAAIKTFPFPEELPVSKKRLLIAALDVITGSSVEEQVSTLEKHTKHGGANTVDASGWRRVPCRTRYSDRAKREMIMEFNPTLLGVAVNVSGSMTSSIRNDRAVDISRLEGVGRGIDALTENSSTWRRSSLQRLNFRCAYSCTPSV